MSMGMYKSFLEWMYYYHTYEPGQEEVTQLNDTIDDDEDMDNLEEKYAARFEQSTTSSTQPPIPTPH